MKNNINKLFLLSTFAILSMTSLTGCANNGDAHPGQGNIDVEVPETEHHEDKGKVNDEIAPVTGYVDGAEEKNKSKEEIYNSDGGLMIPFDMAYPEYMNKALYDENSILVKCLDSDIDNIASTLANDGVIGYSFTSKAKDNVSWYKLSLENVKSNEVINTYRKMTDKAMEFDLNYVIDKSGLYASPADTVPTAGDTSTTIDNCNIEGAELNTYFKDQIYFKEFGLKETYKFIKDNALLNGGAGTIVAVIDTGIDLDHEDLFENIYHNKAEVPNNNIDDDGNGFVDDVTGWNFVDNNNNPDDDQGHGTHVAGIIGAKNNRIGTLGIAYNTKIMPIKAGDGAGFFSHENIAKAINYAYLNGADVINMSFGGSVLSLAVQEALEAAYTTSSLIAAAGNDGIANEMYKGCPIPPMPIPSYPAALSYVLGVMSCNFAGVESPFTNYDGIAYTDKEYEVYAPGEGIWSTIPDNKYTALNGTSMAAPIVSGMAALLRSKFTDKVKYPSKFITAQIAGAPQNHARCCNPELHGKHNLPAVVNILSSFTAIPKPDVSLLTYRVFDFKEYSSVNNNNGNLDAGETVYIAPTLINRWGMSKETHITFDTKSSISQQDSKYVTLENVTLNFDGIGTYSRKHYMTLDNQNSYYIGCDLSRSLKVTLSKNAPNLVNVPINYHIDYKNALDDSDLTTYENNGAFHITINNGEILPKVINKDTVLTKDKYYILQEPMHVIKNTTLTVEPGTTIVFDNSDRTGYQGIIKDSPQIFNNGTIKMIGTEKERINITTAGYYDIVVMTNNGYGNTNNENNNSISLQYCDVQNPVLHGFDLIDHCKFDITCLGASESSDSFIVNGKPTDVYCSVLETETYSNNLLITEPNFINTFWPIRVESNNIRNSTFINNGTREFRLEFTSVPKECTLINNASISVSFEFRIKTKPGKYESMLCDNKFDNVFIRDTPDGYKQVSELFQKINEFEKIVYCNPFEYLKVASGNCWLTFAVYKENGNYYAMDGTLIDDSYNQQNFKLYNYINTNLGKENVYGIMFQIYCVEGGSIEDITSSSNNYLPLYATSTEAVKNRIRELDGFPTNADDSYINFLTADLSNLSISVNDNSDIAGQTIENFFTLNTNDSAAKDGIIRDGNDSPDKPILGEASKDDPNLAKLWPYVLECKMTDKDGNVKHTFGKEIINVSLTFNRDMNIDTPIRIRFGSSKPFADYEIKGKFIDARTWCGSFFINTTIENGEQYIRIEGGAAADDSFMTVQEPPKRFKFNIDTTIAMAQVINANAQDDGVLLSWMQDEYSADTIMGYNVYKSDKKDGLYQKINTNVISKDENSFLDKDVLPGETYWYTFTIVLSDFSETNPVGKAAVTAKDTMAPSLYHTPNYQGYTTDPFKITCKAKDNISMNSVKLYYRTTGTTDYKCVEMNNINDIYSYLIPITDLNIAGLEYYIEASDGTNFVTKGTAENPYQVIIKDGELIANKGDVDGDGSITVIDAQMILNSINGEVQLSAEQFARADIDENGELSTFEALMILQYINGTITTLNPQK